MINITIADEQSHICTRRQHVFEYLDHHPEALKLYLQQIPDVFIHLTDKYEIFITIVLCVLNTM